MSVLFLLLGLLFAFISAFLAQIITFFPFLSVRWVHNFEWKRWGFRLISLGFVALWLSDQSWSYWDIAAVFFLLLFYTISFVGYNPAIFRALYSTDLVVLPPEDSAMPAGEEVIGVCLHREARAYSVQDLVLPRHLIHDQLDGEEILISYCAACRSSIVYDLRLEGRMLSFEVMAVYRRNMVIRDKQTGSIWQQATGECIYGKLKGKRLRMFPYQQLPLHEWLHQYPDSQVAIASPTAPKARIPEDRLKKMLRITNKRLSIGKVDPGKEIDSRAVVFGLEHKGAVIAYPVSELMKNAEFEHKLAGDTIYVCYNRGTDSLILKKKLSGEQLVGQRHWWMGWKEFHPNTEIWIGDKKNERGE